MVTSKKMVLTAVLAFLVGSLFPLMSVGAKILPITPDVNCHSNSGGWAITAVWENTTLPVVQVSGPIGSVSDDNEALFCGRQGSGSQAAFVTKLQGANIATVRWYDDVNTGEFVVNVIDTSLRSK